jgi:hypothetical protein
MSQFLGEHYNLLLGIAAGLIWIGALIWFFHLSGFLKEWREKWRTRHDKQVW